MGQTSISSSLHSMKLMKLPASSDRALWIYTFSIFVTLITTPVVVSVASAATTPSLISLWHGDGNALDAVGANHGVLVNGVGFAPGVSGQGFLLDGTSFVRVADSASLDLTNALTIQMWFKRDESLPSGTTFTLLDKRTASLANYGAVMSPNFGLQLYFNSGGGFAISSSPLPSGGAWHHFAGTYQQLSNGVELITYVDGQAVRTNTLSGTLAAAVNNAPLSIGSAMNGDAAYFKGLIDEVALYNYALTPSQVASNYSALDIQTASLILPRFLSSGNFRFSADRVLAGPYVVETSTNLVDWNVIQLTTVTNPFGVFRSDTNPPVFQRYYRLRDQ
jgi:hypothetical protein